MYYNNSNSYSTLNSKPVARLQVVCFHLTWQHGKTLKCKTRAPKQQQHSPKIKLSSSHKQNCVALFTFATHTHTHLQSQTLDLWHDRLLGDVYRQRFKRDAQFDCNFAFIWGPVWPVCMRECASMCVCVCANKYRKSCAEKYFYKNICTQNGIFF